MSAADISGADFAVLDEGQNALEPSEVLHGRASLGALRGGALSSSRYRAWASLASEVRIAIRPRRSMLSSASNREARSRIEWCFPQLFYVAWN